MISIQPSTEKDAIRLARNMRKQDLMEVEACDTDPVTALLTPLHAEMLKHLLFFMVKSLF